MNIIHPCVRRISLENIILSEHSQTEKQKHFMISLTCGILQQKGKFLETEENDGYQVLEVWGDKEMPSKGTSLHLQDEQALAI